MLISAFALLIAFFSESMRRDKTGCEKDNSGMIHIRMMRETPGKKKKKKAYITVPRNGTGQITVLRNRFQLVVI